MKYIELYNEYVLLTNKKQELLSQMNSLPSGYVSAKTIKGKKQYYLQRREDGKMKSEYIKADELEHISEQLTWRTELQSKISELEAELSRLEEGLSIISHPLSQRVWFFKQGNIVDSLPVEKRCESKLFVDAITALEGLSASECTDAFLSKWVAGEGDFTEFYLDLLERNSIIERVSA
jgi:hypothetical protein